MLKFNTPQQIAENTIIDQIILAAASGDQTISVNQFKGAVVVDPNLGNYVVIDFTVTDTSAMNIGQIRLMHGQTPVAFSEDKQLLIVKEDHKNLKIRLAAQFAGAENCKFNTTSVNLPYATPFREGVVRFTNGDEINKSGTVYSAADVDAKIDQVTESLGNLKDYAKINAENTFAENNTFTKNITVNGEINGDAVATTATANEKDALVVSVGFANNKYLSKTDASSIYLTQTDATNTYLTKEAATQAAINYAKLDGGNTFTGDVNTFKEVSATKFSGDGVVTSITTNTLDDAALIPTDGAVKTYVDSKTGTLTQNITTLQEKDNDLQSQIDGINAGQNLADIVDTAEALATYDISHLKAKGDYQHGTDGDMWEIGDKVQVLGGADAQSSVYELVKGPMPAGEESKDIQSTNNTNYYWRYIGVYGTNAYTKSEIDEKVNTINTNIGKKADQTYVDTELAKKANTADVYSKTEADGKFAVKTGDNTFTGNNTFNGTIIGSAVTSNIAKDITEQGAKLTTSSGVSNFVTKVVDDKITELQGGMSYLKLTSSEKQTVDSNVEFNGVISGTAVAERALADSNGTRLPTEGAVVSFVDDKLVENRSDISDKTKVGAMGLFLYTGNDFKEMGAEVAGASLQAVGMQLPMDGVVSWSQGAVMQGRWKLLNNTIAGEPCLVLAIRTV